MLLKVDPVDSFSGTFRVPSSKPETQRAILVGTLADGTSRVFNDLRCDETETMKNACRAIGAKITEHDDYLEIQGIGQSSPRIGRVIQSRGSGLVFRVVTALASVQPSPVVVTGDATLRNRVMEPLLQALRELGADIESIVGKDQAPVVNWGHGLKGGTCRLPGDISSQFITAILFAAPLADGPVEIEVTGEVYSQSYIRQTLASLTNAGIKVSASEDMRHYQVEPSAYQAQDVTTHEDYTSASYLLAAAALFPGRTVLTNVYGDSMQGEFAIVPILEQLGVSVTFDRASSSLTVDNPEGSMRGDFEVDVRDCPNIVPTLAALGAYVQGSLRVTGGRLTRFHKASRIEAMAAELTRAGVDIEVLYDDGICDGFLVRGAQTYPGGVTLSSWGDHRIFMSLFVAGLRMQSANRFSGFEDVKLSFPTFLEEFAKAGVRTTSVEEEKEPAAALG
ncbi:3-phosphoshikimate 1-carboxyvinyltransferase [Streptomyces sp. R1]|uniref:3-phosphoshikimate 1-carboxyvinyltransferase n=1 Tax=Streptomyces TaxID=1883 RepID=UPI0007763F36|nr:MULTISPECIES: 3-phosphoshikimate 1-carboxyvinyltransferase [unclassified Streptomyces]MCC8338343.1 3-phosphoshikimate 1-carboxyvinyltransferase [Streptomyces sp. R1]MDA4886984.1 3-phosphoshikimate 1-carboxyvinyltransferase [Streptomyces sp. MS2A]